MEPDHSAVNRDRLALAALAGLCVAAFAFMEWIALTQFQAGKWYLYDVGYIHYYLWKSVHGAFMDAQLGLGNYFGYHFSPLLVLLIPIVYLSQYPIPLVTSYVLALSLCPVPLYYLSRQHSLPRVMGLAMGFLFLANHFVASLELSNHFESWFVLFMLATIALARRGGAWFWTCAVLALAVKEEIPAIMGVFAIYMLIERWQDPVARRRFIRVIILCIVWVAVEVVVLWAVGSRQNTTFYYAGRYKGVVPRVESLFALGVMFLSVGFLSLFGGWKLLLALAPFPILLGNTGFMQNLLYYYSYPFLPFLFWSAIAGTAVIQNRIPRRLLLTCYVLAVALAQFAMPTRTDGYRRLPFAVTARDRYRLELARNALPREAPTVIQHGLFGITPTRQGARRFEKASITPDAVVFLDLKSPLGMDRKEYIQLARGLMDEVDAGKRKLLHQKYDILIFGPRTGR